MASIVPNSALRELHGRIGEIEFRCLHGRTIAQARQQRVAPWSAAQDRQRRAFAGYAAYAARVRDDPPRRAAYAAAGAKRRKRPLNYWQMAVRDAAHPPELPEANARDLGRDGSGVLRIRARDDFEVVRVHVAVRDAAGRVLRWGEAERTSAGWLFPLPPPAPDEPRAVEVVMTAFDRPGNFAVGVSPLPR